MIRSLTRSAVGSVATLGAMYLFVSQGQSSILDNAPLPPEWRMLAKTMLNGGRRPADLPAQKGMNLATPAVPEKIQNLTLDLNQLVDLPGFGSGSNGACPPGQSCPKNAANAAGPVSPGGIADLLGKHPAGPAKKQPGREAGSGPLTIHNDTIHDEGPASPGPHKSSSSSNSAR